MAISTNQKLTIYRTLYENTGPGQQRVYSRQHLNISTSYSITGRDSVLAQHQRGDQGMSHQMRMTQDQKDADLILRLQDHMYRGWGGYDLKYLKDALQKKDKNKASKLPKHEVGASLHYIDVISRYCGHYKYFIFFQRWSRLYTSDSDI